MKKNFVGDNPSGASIGTGKTTVPPAKAGSCFACPRSPKYCALATLLALAVLVGCAKKDTTTAEVAAPAQEEAGAHVTRNDKGEVVVKISDEMAGDMGLVVAQPVEAKSDQELKTFGRVLDPAAVSLAVGEFISAESTATASLKDMERVKSLELQNNASARALETAMATSARDSALAEAARVRLQAATGKSVSDRKDLAEFARSLVASTTALVRVELPAGETAQPLQSDARLETIAGRSVSAEFLGTASGVDPAMQSRGILLLVKTDAAALAPGEALTAWLKLPGEALSGVIIPRNAVVRTEGSAWIYVTDGSGEGYVRTQIVLDHPTNAGWFVDKGVSAADHIVVNGAGQLLSEELKGRNGGE